MFCNMCIFRVHKPRPSTYGLKKEIKERVRDRKSVVSWIAFEKRSPSMFPPLSAGPSGAYSPDATMGYMMDGQAASMMHRPPGDPTFHNQYHYPPEYYGHHL
ncbi:homeobox protein homothorax isoform X4 [Vespula squamosa]|uniref:Homeobox protein homothorax isoform X4 n=1 Tax=Vespula squamosa TaxID=30214 RepID=A0ABD1ZU47_VESSQ